jgi:hypothetical protein
MLRRNAFTWSYLGLYVITGLVYASLGAHAQDVLATWASTNVVNLEHDPVGSLIASAFVGQGNYVAWPVLIALAMFPANRALGNATFPVCTHQCRLTCSFAPLCGIDPPKHPQNGGQSIA